MRVSVNTPEEIAHVSAGSMALYSRALPAQTRRGMPIGSLYFPIKVVAEGLDPILKQGLLLV